MAESRNDGRWESRAYVYSSEPVQRTDESEDGCWVEKEL